jgi:hypothetical protein
MVLGLTALGFLSVTWSFAAPTHKVSLDERLLADLPKITQYLHNHHYQTVGVIKFKVKKGDQPGSYNAGTLNTKMALKLEHALVMAYDKNHPITVLQDVTTEASRSRGLGLTSTRGRRSLMEHSYPVAWGNDKQKPDVLLTGEVRLSKDMKKATVVIQALQPKQPDHLDTVVQLKSIDTDPDLLASAGQSFVIPRRLRGRSMEDAAAEDAADRDDKPKDNPLESPDDPVKLEVFYDGQAVTLEPDAGSPGELKVKRSKTTQDVKAGQKVNFKITNPGKAKIGVVLSINARNTLFQEDLTQRKAAECSKWILDPGESYSIDGFYMSQDGKSVMPFRVLSDEESAKVEMAPEHKGVFALVVFREGSGSSSDNALNIELARKLRDKGKSGAEASDKLKRALHVHEVNGRLVPNAATQRSPSTHNAKRHDRGLIVAGEAGTGSQLKELQVKFDPQPVMSLLIRYYSDTTSKADTDTTEQ